MISVCSWYSLIIVSGEGYVSFAFEGIFLLLTV